MTIFQFFLLTLSAAIFFVFFKKLFSEDYPKRGIDYEAKSLDGQIGGINHPEKIFSTPEIVSDRLSQLLSIADESVQNNNMIEAKKALQSAMIIEKDNPEIISKYAFVLNNMNDFTGAVEHYGRVLELNPQDDMAHAALANALHHLNDHNQALEHHKKSIALDSDYAPHYYNYANTLYDMGNKEQALGFYKKAYNLDGSLELAKEMIDELTNKEK